MNEGFFPYTSEEALAMLYVSKKITAETTPEELADCYRDALAQIKAANAKHKAEHSGNPQVVKM